MKKLLAVLSAVIASTALAYAANLPLVPSSPTYSEPSQIVGTLNSVIQQLNGQAGYAAAQVVSLGTGGTASGGSGAVTLNAQHGVASFTGVSTLTTGSVVTLTLTNSTVAANSVCFAQVLSGGAAGSAPYVSTATPTAGQLAFIVANGGTTATGATVTFAIGFNCM
jgi:hypothetical protein